MKFMYFNIRCNLIRNKVLFISEWSSKDQSYEAKAVNNIFLCNRMALDYNVKVKAGALVV